MSKVRILKIVNWKNKEYAYVADDEPKDFCSLCCLYPQCASILKNDIRKYEISELPMTLCAQTAAELNTPFGMFLKPKEAEEYVKENNDSV